MSSKAFALITSLSIAAILSGCEAPQPLSVSQSRLLPATTLTSEDLLYVADAKTSMIYVLSYPQGTYVTKFSLPSGSGDPYGECVGTGGAVWIVSFESGTIYKYGHGGTTPVATLGGTGTAVYGCSVDPLTGDLAAVSPLTGSAYIWRHASGVPVVFAATARLYYCGYDGSGNLFMDGAAPPNQKFALFELPNGSGTIEPIRLNKNLRGVGQVQWDGSYITVEDTYPPDDIYEVDVRGSQAKIVDTIRFDEQMHSLGQSWIQDASVIVPFSVRGSNTSTIGLWNYPAGGSPTAIFKHVAGSKHTGAISAVAVSPAASRHFSRIGR